MLPSSSPGILLWPTGRSLYRPEPDPEVARCLNWPFCTHFLLLLCWFLELAFSSSMHDVCMICVAWSVWQKQQQNFSTTRFKMWYSGMGKETHVLWTLFWEMLEIFLLNFSKNICYEANNKQGEKGIWKSSKQLTSGSHNRNSLTTFDNNLTTWMICTTVGTATSLIITALVISPHLEWIPAGFCITAGDNWC